MSKWLTSIDVSDVNPWNIPDILVDVDVLKPDKSIEVTPILFNANFIFISEGELFSFFHVFSIIYPETTEEIKPTLYFDEEANEVKGKCKLKTNKKYFIFEIM